MFITQSLKVGDTDLLHNQILMTNRNTSCFCSLSLLLATLAYHLADAAVPAIFVFGDSTVDVGTNNFIPECRGKANFRYYGIDYPGSVPTGRFSNGYNSADSIGMDRLFVTIKQNLLLFQKKKRRRRKWYSIAQIV